MADNRTLAGRASPAAGKMAAAVFGIRHARPPADFFCGSPDCRNFSDRMIRP